MNPLSHIPLLCAIMLIGGMVGASYLYKEQTAQIAFKTGRILVNALHR